jgi:hypothetical protein
MTNIPLSASELGNLWQAYREKSMILRMLEYFLEKSNEPEAKAILQTTYNSEAKNIEAIRNIFLSEGAAIPEAFTEKDVNKEVPPLFAANFDLMFIRMMSKVLIALYALHSGMSYRQDVRDLYMVLTSDIQNIYNQATQYLLEKGALPRPPIVPMPKEVEFVNDTSYMSGFNLFEKTRALNTVEIGLVYQSLETNITGMQLMTGFAQVAKEPEVKKYFLRGKILAKREVNTMSSLLLESDLQAPSTWAGVVTDSTQSPFSDKLMMYNTSLLAIFGLGSNSIGAAFSFRSDLIFKMGRILKNTFEFAEDGGKIMTKHGWLEEPPQAADRHQLLKV